MKRFILIFLSLLLPQVDLYASVEVQSKIESVVVYSDSAYVKRTGVGTVKKGQNIFKFTGLPAGLIDNSVMVGIKSGNGKILDVKIEKTHLTKQYQEKVKVIKEKIDKLDQEIKLLNAEVSAINNYIEFLRKLSPFTTGVKLLQNEFEGYAKFIENGIKNGYRDSAEIESKLNKLKEEKANLEKELTNLGKQREETKNIILTLQSPKDGELEFEIGYLVDGVGWNSQYDIYVDTSRNAIGIDVYASILQNTGEDWKDIKLEISTSKPVVGRLGELTPWYVDIYKPREPVFYKSMDVKKSILLEKLDEEEAKPEGEELKEPQLKEGLTSFSFTLKDLISIPSDNQPHRVFLASKSIEMPDKKNSLLKYTTVPKLSPYVYLTGDFKNPFDFPIFAGKINVYIDGRFVNSEMLSKSFAPAEEMQISLGIDESIRVERKRVKKFTEYAGIVSKTEKIIFEYEIVIRNGKSKEVGLIVKDNYPISLNEQIKIQLEEPKEKEAEITKDGIIIWKLDVAPKSSKTLNLRFAVEYPKGLRISGIE